MREVVNEQTRFLSTEFFGPYLSLLLENVCRQTVCGNIYIFLFAGTFFSRIAGKMTRNRTRKKFRATRFSKDTNKKQ